MNLQKIKIEYILLNMLIVGVALIFVSFFRQLNFADNSQQVKKGERVEIVTGDTLEQRFVSEHDGLSNLKILFGNKTLKEYNSLRFILSDEKCEEDVAEKVLGGEYNLDSKYLYNFNFPKIDNSKNKKYCLKITLEENSEWGVWRKVKGKFKNNNKQGSQKVRLFKRINDSDNIEKYVIVSKAGKIKNEGSNGISFRQSYKNQTIIQDFQQLNQRMSQYKPWFLKGGYLVVVIAIASVLTISCIIYLFNKNFKK